VHRLRVASGYPIFIRGFTMEKERRQTIRVYPRRPVQLIIDCDWKIIGRVHNISEQGASVEYEGKALPCEELNEVSAEIAIDQQSRQKVNGIRCAAIYDISTLAHNQSFRGMNMRLCGLKFQGLSRPQQNKLNQLLASIS